MKIYTLTLGALGTNCYIVANAENNAVIIDPASDFQEIYGSIENKNLTPQKILLTHGHFDHIMAAAELADEYKIPVYIHENDVKLLSDTDLNLFDSFDSIEDFREISAAKVLYDGDEIVQDELTFKVLHTAGHTGGSVCFICENALFSGDTLFAGSVGRTDMVGGNYENLKKSLKKIDDLTDNYKIYPGHGGATTLENERKNNIY
ncbi:MAG: MBL fold metallo-hydrolase, partial [Oscillospiraceae bacterium]